MKCRQYKPEDCILWNSFILDAKNGHFMFNRYFMEYHSDRYEDHSLVFERADGSFAAVLPANIQNDIIYSHQGLTFGGLVMSNRIKLTEVIIIFDKLVEYLVNLNGVNAMVYKRAPDIYSSYPAQEDLYALHLAGARLTKRYATSAIEFGNSLKFSKGRKSQIKRAKNNGVIVSRAPLLSSFWPLLEEVLNSSHNVRPVHSLKEITLLADRFHNEIKCFVGKIEEKVVSGAVIFETKDVIHTQYLAVNNFGRKIGALDCVIETLFKMYEKDKRFLNFGTSTDGDENLNVGLLEQKESFGARTFVQDVYTLQL